MVKTLTFNQCGLGTILPICGLSLSLVLPLNCSKGFSLVTPVFFAPENPTFQIRAEERGLMKTNLGQRASLPL